MSPAKIIPLMTEAERLCRPENELSPQRPLACAAAECRAAPAGGSRLVMEEIWFTCANGHLNAVGSSDRAEAA